MRRARWSCGSPLRRVTRIAPWSACRAIWTWFREKRPDKKHDFLKDPITLVRKGNTMMADGTTLGADNGVAVATSLAIMDDTSLVHGPLEFLFTIDEETGLTGAHSLQPGFLKSKILLNLDSEEEGALYVGCSGGRDTMGTWPLETEAAPAGTARPRSQGRRPARRPLRASRSTRAAATRIKILNRVLLGLAPDRRPPRSDRRRQQAERHPARRGGAGVHPEEALDEAKAVVAAMHADVPSRTLGVGRSVASRSPQRRSRAAARSSRRACRRS